MKNLLRAAAVCALTVTALSTVEAATWGNCLIQCSTPGAFPPFTFVTVTTTQSDCCGADVSGYCPPGSTSGFARSWGGYRC